MRAYEIYENVMLEAGTPMSAKDFAENVLVPKYGFKHSYSGFMFTKDLSDNYYITVRSSSYLALNLVNRKTLKSMDTFALHGRNDDVDMNRAANSSQVLNKITDWTRQFSSASPQI